jgi:hypothetical protein
MTAQRTSSEIVDAALAEEAAKLNAEHRGIHRFDPIQRTLGAGCNWTASFHVIGSRIPLDLMREALERVQARYPVVDFEA